MKRCVTVTKIVRGSDTIFGMCLQNGELERGQGPLVIREILDLWGSLDWRYLGVFFCSRSIATIISHTLNDVSNK